MVNCYLSSISHRFGDIGLALRSRSKITHPSLSPERGTPFEFRHQTWQAQSYCIGLHFIENCMILTLIVLSQITRVTDRQTTERQRLMTIVALAMQLQRSSKSC